MKAPAAKAFTLIELLVVIAVIGVMVGGIGIALTRGGDRGAALQGGQGILASLISGVRGQAALKQADAGLFVNGNPDSDGFLRMFRIAVNTGSPSSPTWTPTGEAVLLPSGIFILPKNSSAFSGSVSYATSWPTKRYSDAFTDTTATTLQNLPSNSSDPKYYLVVKLSSRGTVIAPAGDNLILAVGEQTSATAIRFSNPDAIRGANLSQYGVLTLINNPVAFDETP